MTGSWPHCVCYCGDPFPSTLLLKVTGSHRKADVCVGGKSWNKEAKSVTEQWILGQCSIMTCSSRLSLWLSVWCSNYLYTTNASSKLIIKRTTLVYKLVLWLIQKEKKISRLRWESNPQSSQLKCDCSTTVSYQARWWGVNLGICIQVLLVPIFTLCTKSY